MLVVVVPTGNRAAVAQLVECILGKDEVTGSIPVSSFSQAWFSRPVIVGRSQERAIAQTFWQCAGADCLCDGAALFGKWRRVQGNHVE